MRKVIIIIAVLAVLIQPVLAVEYAAPTAPSSAQKYMPDEINSFADGLWYVIKSGVQELNPGISEAAGVCLSAIAISILVCIVRNFTGVSHSVIGLVSVVSIGTLLFRSADTLLRLGTDTVEQLSDYGKLLIPTLTAASAAAGTATTSASLYTGTMIFTTVLSSLVSGLVVPLIYVYMALGIGDAAFGGKSLSELKRFIKWLSTWIIKIVLYVFTGYMSITGVISGNVDSVAVKATKLTISGMVPIVGSVISDASETIILSAGILRNTAGIYGIVAIVAACIGPFIRIGAHYLMLKVTTSVCGVFGECQSNGLMKDMTGAMGLVLGMTGSVCLLLMISVVCFLRSI